LGGFLKVILGIVVIVVIVAVLGLGYLGLIPGVSSLFGSDKPRDLGVKVTQANLDSANAKTGVKLVTLQSAKSPKESISYSGQKNLKAEFSSEEITAMLANGKWKYSPVSDCQVRFNQDGSVEVSGLLRVDRIYSYAEATGIPASDVKQFLDALKLGSVNPPFYMKGTASAKDNKATVNFESIEIGRLNVPADLIANNKTRLIGLAEDRARQVPGLNAKSLTFANGIMQFDGTVPETEATEH
jgi:hypothetical protein